MRSIETKQGVQKMNYLNKTERRILAEEAKGRLAEGYEPGSLCHVLWQGGEVGLSTPLPANTDMGGYTAVYYPLCTWADLSP